jgi:hypothetical protein
MATSESDFYHDDPVDISGNSSKKKLPSLISFLLFAVAGTFFIQTTLAANVSLNSGAPVEFGQGTMQTTACSGASELTVTPLASFTNASGGGGFYFTSLTVSNIPTSCYGKDFTINAYGNTDNTALSLFNATSKNVVIYNNDGTFETGVGSTGMSVTSGSGSFTANFASPVALSSTVFKVSVQSGEHSSGVLGINWTSRNPPADNMWKSATYGSGIFVAVSKTGTNNRVMTSSDGITWTSRAAGGDNAWQSITYGNGVFVAVSSSGTNSRVMTSPDGITWTSRAAAIDNSWQGIAYGNGIFVAVSESGINNRVMTSPDGITWTSRTTPADNLWNSITYGNGTFVATSRDGLTSRVMTSPDGITWTSRNSLLAHWYDVTYGNGTFVAVAYMGVNGYRVMTSPDGITWTSRSAAKNNSWYSVTYGNGIFVAVSADGTGDRVMTSPDGVNWTSRTSATENSWHSVTYGNGTFVALSLAAAGNEIMTSTW